MNARFFPMTFVVIVLFLTACQRPLIVDDDQTDNGAQWELLDFKSERYIQGLHATKFELYAISENSFARFNSDHEIIEKRPFSTNATGSSIPALTDNAFVRLTTNDQNRQVIEFHHARNATEIVKVLVDTLPAPTGNSLDIETKANALGAFNSDGNLFLMAAKVSPARYYSLFLFEVEQNQQVNAFVSVKLVKRIDLTDLDANTEGVVSSIRFRNGNFYLASLHGAWRISAAGNATQLFQQRKVDCFTWQGNLYMTGDYDYDLDKSIDNGLTWERVNVGTELRHVEVADTTIFTQEVTGLIFAEMPKDFKKTKQIIYPAAVESQKQSAIFYGLAYYAGKYYFGLDREIYYTQEVKVE